MSTAQHHQMDVLGAEERSRDVLSAAFGQMVLEVTERMAAEVARVLDERTHMVEQRLEGRMRAQLEGLDRRMLSAMEGVESRMRVLEEKVEGLEERPASPPVVPAQVAMAQMEERLKVLEGWLGRAFESLMPKVEALLQQQLERNPRTELPIPSPTSLSPSGGNVSTAGPAKSIQNATSSSANSTAHSAASTPPPSSPRGESPATRRRFVEGLFRVVNETDETEKDLKRRALSPGTRCRLVEELWQAAKDGRADDVRSLLARGADVNARNGDQRTPLHCASERGHPEVVSLLLRGGADVGAKSGSECTALHYAAARDRSCRCASLLLDAGAAVNSRDISGWTPLHMAAWKSNEAAARALLAKGADLSAKTNNGKTPLDYAGNNAVRRLLRR